jgi:hypothetical protein
VLLPHVPWAYLPSGRAYPNGDYLPGLSDDYRWTGSEGARFSAYQRMLLQTRYVDRLLGRLLRRLRRTGLFDRAVVVIVADHGAAMRPNDFRRRFTEANAGELAPMPLFIKAPGQRRGRVMTKHVRTLDVLPTVADLVGARVSWHTDGRSLAGGTYPEPARLTLHRVFGGVDVVVSVKTLERERSQALSEQLRLFGRGSSFPGRGGPSRRDDLIGRRIEDAAVPPDAPPVVVANPDRFRLVRPATGVVPALVTGGVRGLAPGDHREIAVTVNGRVAAVGATFDLAGTQSFAIVVPDKLLHQGSNDVRAFALD